MGNHPAYRLPCESIISQPKQTETAKDYKTN